MNVGSRPDRDLTFTPYRSAAWEGRSGTGTHLALVITMQTDTLDGWGYLGLICDAERAIASGSHDAMGCVVVRLDDVLENGPEDMCPLVRAELVDMSTMLAIIMRP